MRRTSLVTTIVFVAGLGIGYFARSPVSALQRRDTHAADLAAIEKLRQKDIEVTLSQDPQRLIDIWTEDACATYRENRRWSASRPSRLTMRKVVPRTQVSRC